MIKMHGIFKIYVCFLVALKINAEKLVNFDKEYIGAVFEPYTKYFENADHQSNYSMKDVQDMLYLTATRFRQISTYSMGTVAVNKNWSESFPTAFTAISAAKLNKNLGQQALSVNIGTWPNREAGFYDQEIKNAFAAAKDANKIFNQTVSGIIIANHYADLGHTLDLFEEHEYEAKGNGLKLGIRTWDCNQLSIAPQNSLQQTIIKNLDFIICQKLGDTEKVFTQELEMITHTFLNWKENFTRMNNAIEVIGETGWHSLDKAAGQETPQSLEIFKKFWSHLADWAKENKFRVDMFTAFDEPWKVMHKKGGTEAHWGWWKRIKNDTSTSDAFQEKINPNLIIQSGTSKKSSHVHKSNADKVFNYCQWIIIALSLAVVSGHPSFL